MRISDWSSDVCSSDLTAPSPLSDSILTAKPYAFLDDAPAEERRTLTVRTGGFAEAASARDPGELDSAAIARVREEMRPEPMNEDELHDALVVHGFLTDDEAGAWPTRLANLQQARRVVPPCTIER